MLASTGLGLAYALTHRAAIERGFPGAARSAVYMAFVLVASFSLAALIGLWRWHRWAVLLFAALSVTNIVLDVVARAPTAHQVTVIVASAAVLALVYGNRHSFRPGHAEAGATNDADGA